MADELLGHFLRTRRGRLRPDDVGLPEHGQRRVPGLRREEVALLAGVSADYNATDPDFGELVEELSARSPRFRIVRRPIPSASRRWPRRHCSPSGPWAPEIGR